MKEPMAGNNVCYTRYLLCAHVIYTEMMERGQ